MSTEALVLKTLESSDPQFKTYMLGDLPGGLRAIPVKSLNPQSSSHVVTFQIISKPVVPFLLKFVSVLKIYLWILPLALAFFIVGWAQVTGQNWDPTQALVSSLALLSWMSAMTLQNDVLDHLSGIDRVFEDSDERALQKGWITAGFAKRLSYGFFGLGALLGAFVIFQAPWVLLVMGLTVALTMWGFTQHKVGLQYRLWTEVSAFILLGPFLALGFGAAVGLKPSLGLLSLGLIHGVWVVLILHLKNLGRIMVQNQLRHANSMTLIGFDQAKVFLQFWFLLMLTMGLLFHLFFLNQIWTVGFLIAGISLFLLFRKLLRGLRSPLSSRYQKDIVSLRTLAFLYLALWILEFLSYVLVGFLD